MGLFDIFKKKNTDANVQNESAEKTLDHETELKVAEQALKAVEKKTLTPCVRLELAGDKPSIFESKVGGIGYVPHDGTIPEDKKGRQLRLLAQLDCSQVVGIEDFPKSGLLQFWILNDDVYGMSFDDITCQDTFRIVYHKDIDNTVTEEEVKAKFKENGLDGEYSMPVNGEFGLKFTSSADVMSESDVRFEKMFCEYYNAAQSKKKINSLMDMDIAPADEIEAYEQNYQNAYGHKIGGYPAFTQWDPRKEDTKYDFLLLQLDSEFGNGDEKIMWGDAGICRFFINRQRLKDLDFDDVIYNWDCC